MNELICLSRLFCLKIPGFENALDSGYFKNALDVYLDGYFKNQEIGFGVYIVFIWGP